MTKEYERAFRELNLSQRTAVTTTDGPLLVIAGPGTGKTQLIGTRVGYILANHDVEPANILLLTFTDAAVAEMRRRLERLVPAQAHKVNIYTYHGFANDLIRSNPEYFEGMENEPIDELAAATMLADILDSLPYDDPLKSGIYYRQQVLTFIADAKQALFSPADIEKVAKANLEFVAAANRRWRKHLDKLDKMSKQSIPIFRDLHHELTAMPASKTKLPAGLHPLSQAMGDSLFEALAETAASGRTNPLTVWKNRWLEKDAAGRFIAAGKKQNQRLQAAAGVYRSYQRRLADARVYDYADMITRAIAVLEKHPEFKFSQAEHYQYLMLDEFQDTNAAQLRLIQLLSDAPVYEGRPNILAVGDDDQAIYAFQGADYANMAAFAKIYRDVKVISLKQNYRSHQDLIDMSANIAEQISRRLHHDFPGIEKTLLAAGQAAKTPPKLQAREFLSDAAELSWIAKQVSSLIKAGTPASEIAVLAPKHKYLEKLLPYLAERKLPVAYEKREDVLEDPQVVKLTQIARLVLALAEGHEELADSLWPEVLSYDFWKIPTETIWEIVWKAKGGAKRGAPLTAAVMKHPQTKIVAGFIMQLGDASRTASLEEMLDAMIGIGQVHQRLDLPMRSPYFEHHFGAAAIKMEPQAFSNLLSNLNLLRSRLRNRQRREVTTTKLTDLINYVDEHLAAEINVLNTSPYHQSQEAVNLLTAYGAKGREFKAVFVMAAQSEVWGSASRNRDSAIKLPANLEHITYMGASDDERLRLFYVAVSRAKSQLYITSHRQTLDGQRRNHLEFLGIASEGEPLTSSVLPAKYRRIHIDDSGHIEPAAVANYWTERHLPGYPVRLKPLLAKRLEEYKLSATHLNKFIDVESAGPQDFFIYYLLGFPQAPTETTAFGTAIHATAAWVGNQLSREDKLPSTKIVLDRFDKELAGGWLRDEERVKLSVRGHQALPVWLKQVGAKLSADYKYEKNFYSESVVVGQARLTGKIDRLLIDSAKREITVVDIKTGKFYAKWASDSKLHKFKQQLMFYKLLVEGSNSFKGYSVRRGIIEFAEPDDGRIVELSHEFSDDEMTDFKNLLSAVWRQAMDLQLPDTSGYPKSLKGIRQFETDLLQGNK